MINKEIPILGVKDVALKVLKIDETNNGNYITMLIHKEARTDMNILDSVFGAMNWKRNHKMIGNNLYCTISVWDEDKHQWVEKEDVGTESDIQAEKGQSSDSFKRAGVNWGIGRELYNAPPITFKLNNEDFYIDKNGKIRVKAIFEITEMEYDKVKGKYTHLVVKDSKGRMCYNLNHGNSNNSIDPVKQNTVTETKGDYCSCCNTAITDKKVVSYSNKFYGRTLCRDCQKIESKAA